MIGDDAHTRPAGGLKGLGIPEMRAIRFCSCAARRSPYVAVTVYVAAFGIADGCRLFRCKTIPRSRT